MNGRQSGYLLLELLLVLVVLGVIAPVVFQYRDAQDEALQARALGTQLSQYTSALRSFLSDQGTGALASVGCTPGNLCLKTGTA
ncbi:MAG: hypothetical protein EPN72_10810 [Nevskiaceae bacterium]|nr:MAG: hypothetical protein EPN63_05820 [Nevskiaceae bacterium]TBR72235.1 MAG: hypothetical protein EPN72_10810 [Nevskiaceae bacterium]